MPLSLRACLVFVSLVTLVFVIIRIRKSQIQLDDSLFWIIFSIFVFLASIVPELFSFFADILEIESPANLVFLLFIFILVIKVFSLSVKLSQETVKTRELVQRLAIEQFERHANDSKSEKHITID